MEDIAEKVISTIASVSPLEESDITPKSELDELEINSLELTEVVMDLEDEYDIQVDLNTAEAWQSLKTVEDVIVLVKALVADKAAETSTRP
ncbi:phosphopantetheine-binding protein [Pseudohoeflea coraliihabitans]|uniref:Acyl carrier protein n=1 Tax=Pseudohoeflea coraliihabitans TaxID=2860393 RepID=A0ABS6WTM4_9HYPH|nr:phosphopantetheine-binding protein [Pseudohoeflea sp. DP4N28-3]MBW3099170.1 acyl carrier protein [Pseudohoeflea sp. DP4N28-3]